MVDVLTKSIGFIFIIFMGYFFKRIGYLKKEDAKTVSTIIMNFTMPCALLSSTTGISFDGAMLLTLLLGFICNLIMIVCSYFYSKGYQPKRTGAYMISCSGYNIGNFIIPFTQAFFPGLGLAYTCMFDIGNSIMTLGGSYALASIVSNKHERFGFGLLIKRLFSSVPFVIYLMIVCFSILRITLPTGLLDVTKMIGNANSFLAMFLIGLLFEIRISKEEVHDVVMILLLRFGFGILLGCMIYFFVPIPLIARKVIFLCLLSPLTTASMIFIQALGYDNDAPAVASSCSIIISILLCTTLLLFFV